MESYGVLNSNRSGKIMRGVLCAELKFEAHRRSDHTLTWWYLTTGATSGKIDDDDESPKTVEAEASRGENYFGEISKNHSRAEYIYSRLVPRTDQNSLVTPSCIFALWRGARWNQVQVTFSQPFQGSTNWSIWMRRWDRVNSNRSNQETYRRF